jgi:hypothetical protein
MGGRRQKKMKGAPMITGYSCRECNEPKKKPLIAAALKTPFQGKSR